MLDRQGFVQKGDGFSYENVRICSSLILICQRTGGQLACTQRTGHPSQSHKDVLSVSNAFRPGRRLCGADLLRPRGGMIALNCHHERAPWDRNHIKTLHSLSQNQRLTLSARCRRDFDVYQGGGPWGSGAVRPVRTLVNIGRKGCSEPVRYRLGPERHRLGNGMGLFHGLHGLHGLHGAPGSGSWFFDLIIGG